MRDVSFEQLFVLTVLVLGLFHLAGRWVATRPRDARFRDHNEDVVGVEEGEMSVSEQMRAATESGWNRASERAVASTGHTVVRRTPPPSSPPPQRDPRARRRERWRINVDLARRGVVLAALLEPCRGHLPGDTGGRSEDLAR